MATYKDLQADLHIHTIASGHAFSTVSEIVEAAQKKGLKTLAITDHGPAMPGGAHPYHFNNLKVLPQEQEGVTLLSGAEVNIIDADGTIDLNDELQNNLDIILMTFHAHCGYVDLGAEENTNTLIKAMKINRVHVLAHPGNQLFKLKYDEVARTAAKLDILIEFNNSSYSGVGSRYNSADLDFELAKSCKKYGNQIVITSDAHIASDVGNFQRAWELVKKAGIKENQILNLDNKKLLNFLKIKR